MQKNKSGFTLAEVLITLGIIGIVAEITIPVLMQNVQDAQFYSAARKNFSVISQATEKMVYDNGGYIWDNSSADSTVLSQNMTDAYSQYFSFIKKDFIENILNQNWYGYKSTTSVVSNSSGGTVYALLLKDGSVLRFFSFQGCQAIVANGFKARCGAIHFDVNGNKKPNMYGRDVHIFWVVTDSLGHYKVIPSGPDTDGYTCSAGSTTYASSYGCAEYIVNNQPLPQ